MPSRAPTYYHWSRDKPCTTNETYGFFVADEYSEARPRRRPNGPDDYDRPFSNSAFFPEILWPQLTGGRSKFEGVRRPSGAYCPPSSLNTFDINRGYTTGSYSLPILRRIQHNAVPVNMMLSHAVSAPPAYHERRSRLKDIYLWHSLAGTLVHARNHKDDE